MSAERESLTSAGRVPFSEPTETDDWEYTTAARIVCEECGEWIYTRRRKGAQGPHALPENCQVCGASKPGKDDE